MYIESLCFNPLGNNNTHVIPINQHRIDYYADLYARYRTHFSINVYKKVFSYGQLADFLFHQIKIKKLLNDVVWILFPRHGYSWDGIDASQELGLKNKHGLNNNLLDIRDCGSLCVYQALQLSKKLNTNVMMVSIETDSIFNAFFYSGFLKITTHKTKNSLFYVEQGCFFDADSKTCFLKAKNKFLEKNNLLLRDVLVFDHADFAFSFDSGFLYKILSKIIKYPYAEKYFLIVDKNKISNRYFLLLLKKE